MSSSIVPDPEPIEAEFPTAEIIPFPSRPKPEEPRPDDRLARALASLTTRCGVTIWTAAISNS